MLDLLVATYPNARPIHRIADNYCIHTARLTERHVAARNGKVVLHLLPPYCPDSNRIERVWQDLHANVTRNHRCRTMKKLLGNTKRYLDNYISRRRQELRKSCRKQVA